MQDGSSLPNHKAPIPKQNGCWLKASTIDANQAIRQLLGFLQPASGKWILVDSTTQAKPWTTV